MSELEAKKKLLVAESEVYRELLKLEIQNFKIYSKRTQRKLGLLQTYLPALMSSLPLVSGLFVKKQQFPLKKLGSLLLFGWKAYSKLGPIWRSRARRRQPNRTAAQEYLAKRI